MEILCNLRTPNRTIVLGGSGAYQVALPDDAPNIEIMNDLAELERHLTVLFTSQAPRVG